MAKTPQNVEIFEDDLIGRLIDLGKKDKQTLVEFKRKETKDPNAVYHKWDAGFYGSKMKQQNFNFDEEKLQEYFPSENVKAATMDIYQQLLGLVFTKLPEAQTWHPEVSCYEVKDKASQ